MERDAAGERPELGLQGTAKSRHPEFEAKKVYLRKSTCKAAARRYEDTTGGDFSELVQELLEKYLDSTPAIADRPELRRFLGA